jgi:hypothetical protein
MMMPSKGLILVDTSAATGPPERRTWEGSSVRDTQVHSMTHKVTALVNYLTSLGRNDDARIERLHSSFPVRPELSKPQLKKELSIFLS